MNINEKDKIITLVGLLLSADYDDPLRGKPTKTQAARLRELVKAGLLEMGLSLDKPTAWRRTKEGEKYLQNIKILANFEEKSNKNGKKTVHRP